MSEEDDLIEDDWRIYDDVFYALAGAQKQTKNRDVEIRISKDEIEILIEEGSMFHGIDQRCSCEIPLHVIFKLIEKAGYSVTPHRQKL